MRRTERFIRIVKSLRAFSVPIDPQVRRWLSSKDGPCAAIWEKKSSHQQAQKIAALNDALRDHDGQRGLQKAKAAFKRWQSFGPTGSAKRILPCIESRRSTKDSSISNLGCDAGISTYLLRFSCGRWPGRLQLSGDPS